jgi:exosortase/archaeosortase family protein
MSTELRRTTMFLLAALAWSVGLFALLRSPWLQERLVVPLTQEQAEVAEYYAGRPPVPIAVTPECSGADALALCLGAILAWPVPWRSRLAGATGAVALVLGLNTLRLATLGRAAGSPSLFNTLHLQVWPAILVLAIAGYVFLWMWKALAATRGSGNDASAAGAFSPWVRRFVPRAAVLLVAFALCGPWIARSDALVAAGAWASHAAAFLLTAAGLVAAASGNVLTTSRGGFVVTPECLATALIPLYVAGVLAADASWPRRALAVAVALPLFPILALARLLLLATPPALAASPLFLVHGFHQLVLASVCVVLLALWREPPSPRRWPRAAARATVALGASALLALVVGDAFTRAVLGVARAAASVAPHTLTDLTPPGDAQGALALLPVYQACLLLALAMTAFAGWWRFVSAFGMLLISQVVVLVVLGEVASHASLVAPALLLRAWAVGLPVVLTLAMLHARPLAAGSLAPLRPATDGPR